MPPRGQLLSWTIAALYLGGIAFLSALAWRNLRLGRGDRRGALRLSAVLFVFDLVGQLLSRHWTASPGSVKTVGPIAQVVGALAQPLFAATWLGYVGLEPFVRRQFPNLLIASTRLLDARWRDPLVGRSVLTGVLAAIVMSGAMTVVFVTYDALGQAVVVPGFTPAPLVPTLASLVGYFASISAVHMWSALLYLAVLLVARWVVRSTTAAWVAMATIFSVMYAAWTLCSSERLRSCSSRAV